MSARAVVALAVVALGAATTAACGARGPLDDTPLDAGTSLNEADATPEDAGGTDATTPPKDAGQDSGKVDDSPLACGSCLLGECGPGIGECLQSQTCRDALQCIGSTCLGEGGQPDPACAIACANGDMASITSILQVFKCVTSTCGGQCSSSLESILDFLGTLGDLRPDGGARPDGGTRPDGGADASAPPFGGPR